jgi:hypothetical protein
MCDIASLHLSELRARLRSCIAWRLDSDTPDERTRSGDELLHVLEELARRGALDHRRSAGDPRPAAVDVPMPRSGSTALSVLVLPSGTTAQAPSRVHSAAD